MVSAQMCPQGWTFHGGHCYTLSTEHKVTWITANRACRERYSLTWSLDTFFVLKDKQTWREIEAESMDIHTTDQLSVMHNNYIIRMICIIHNFLCCLFDFRYKGTLASILSKVDMDWLWDFSGRKPFWIGGFLFSFVLFFL